ncbi:OmpA family protein [Flavilitoribacter nigricans]|nr:OmpA family protein [Flavilitoribacter nigricans]
MYKNALLLMFLVLCGSLSLQAQEQETSIVYFALDSDVLSPDARQQLDGLLETIGQLDRWKLDVRAHTDATGTDQYNEALAQRRAAAVRTYLTERDLPTDLVSISTFGEHRPAESNVTETGRQRNRRVEIDLYHWPLHSLNDLIGGLNENGGQFFSFASDQSVAITGADGTTVWIPSDIFVHADGRTAHGDIQLEMREAYTYADMIAQSLSTHSGDRILETGGMVYLEARLGEEQLQLREGGELVISMPTESTLPDMQLFTGATDANGNLQDWNPTGQGFKTNKMATLRIADPPAMPDVRTGMTFFKEDLSGEPIEPAKPRAPVYPSEPKRESIQYNPGFFKKLVMGRKKIEAREEAIYAQKVEQYEARLERYPELLAAHELEMERYESKMDRYREEMLAYEAGLKAQWKAHQQRQREKYKEAYELAEVKYRRTLEAYEAYKAKKIADYEAAVEQGAVDQRSLNEYFFTVNKMGWINCDRFYNIAASEKEPLMVMDDDEQEERVFILFKERRSALNTIRKKDHYTTLSVPRGMEVRVIGLKVKDGRPLLAIREVTVGEIDQIELEYEPRRLSEIRETMASLD